MKIRSGWGFVGGGHASLGKGKMVSAALLAVLLSGVQAEAEVLVSRYQVNLSGVRIGDAVVRTTLDKKNYKVAVSADVGPLLNNTKVEGEASGVRAGVKLTPERYRLTTSDGQQSSVDFKANTAKGEKTGFMQGVLDPLTALLGASLRPASASAAPCDNVLPVLMSRNRFNVTLRPPSEHDGDRDPRLVMCDVRFAATASASGGPLPHVDNVKWEVGFQKLTKPEFWLVETLSLPSDMGTVTIDRVETSISGT
jgi:hypothetical protein